jgi:hypothetical protein
MKCLIECSLSHQFVERDSILGQGAYLIGLITYGYNYRCVLYCGSFLHFDWIGCWLYTR